VLVGDDRRLAGVIDWGDVHRGDPAIDLSIAHIVLPGAAHAAFRAAYGPIAPDTWAVARLRALWHTLMILPYARERADADLVREVRWTLRSLAD
jgi:aminoglycoside phosphotransferase (APT) family kinase protein